MKYSFAAIILLFVSSVSAQSYVTDLDNIGSLIKEIGTESYTYLQKIKSISDDGDLEVSIESVDKRGKRKSENFIFNIRDINTEQMGYSPKKDVIQLNFRCEQGNKYIINNSEGEFKGYLSEFVIYQRDIDNVKRIVDLSKSLKSEFEGKKLLNEPPAGYENIQDWLIMNSEKFSPEGYKYSISFDPINTLICTLTENNSTGKSSEINTYTFNVFDLSENLISSDVKNNYQVLELSTKEKLKYISVNSNGEKQNNTTDLSIRFRNPNDLKRVKMAFESLIVNSEPIFTSKYVEPKNETDAKGYLKNALNIEIDGCKVKILPEEEGPDLSFHLADLDALSLKTGVVKNTYELSAKSKGNLPLFTLNSTGEYSFEKSFEVNSENLEKFRFVRQSFKILSEACENTETFKVPDVKEEELIKWVSKSIPNFKSEDESVTQSIEPGTSDACQMKFVVNENSGGKTNIVETDLKAYLIDLYSSELSYSSKNIFLILNTLDKEKILETTINGKPDDLVNTVKIRIDDVQKAKEIYEVFKEIVRKCK